MTRQRWPLAKPLLFVAGSLALVKAARIFTGGSRVVSGPDESPPERREDRNPSRSDDGHSRWLDLATYGAGYVVALALTLVAFALVYWRWLSGATAFAVVLALALAQALMHFRCFLHVSLSRSARDDLQLVLFTTVIICLMVGGTLVVLFNLRMRMM